MKNKKGISIGRILLYVLFLSLIALFVYTLFITFKAMKKKSPGVTESINSSLRFANGDSYAPIYYNPIDDMNGYYFTFLDDNFGTGSANPFYPNSGSSISVYPFNINGSFYRCPIFRSNSNSYVLDYGSMITNNVFYAKDNYPNYYHENGYFDVYDFCFGFVKCDILMDNFNFTITGDDVRSTFSLFYISDSCVNSNGQYIDYIRVDNLSKGVHYDLRDIMPSVDASSTKIYAFGFGVYVNSSVSSYTSNHYLNDDFHNSLNNFIYTNSRDIFITFDRIEYPNEYRSAYDSGYNSGYSDAQTTYENAYNELISQNNAFQSTIDELNQRISTQQEIIGVLQLQVDNATGGFKNLFFTFADIPFRTVSNALGFEFWGINLFRFFVGVITALGIVWLIKKFL